MKNVVVALVAALVLAACTGIQRGVAPAPVPGAVEVRVEASVDGSGVGPNVKIGGVPVTQLVKWRGRATVTAIATLVPPAATVYFDGDAEFVVEPVAGAEAQAVAANVRGELVIRRNGVAGALNAPGTIKE